MGEKDVACKPSVNRVDVDQSVIHSVRERLSMFFNGFFVVLVTVAGSGFGENTQVQTRFGIAPGPLVKATEGEVWPKPQNKMTSSDFLIVRPSLFEFKVVGNTCPLLDDALKRYKQDLKNHEKTRRNARSGIPNELRKRRLVSEESFKGYMDELEVNLNGECQSMPHPNMDEQYGLKINSEDVPGKSIVYSQSVWGILRGLETWSQLIHPSADYRALMINSSSILDFPRFPHRGLLIDTSRHFLPMQTIFSMLKAMAMNKMNILHWHVVDDQSFPFQSQRFPELSAKGAYAATHVYSPQNVRDVIAFAAARGIRVIPEFDTPGHTRSWGEAYPNLLTECYSDGKPDGSLGPMNPIKPDTYSFMKEILQEVKDTFPDPYIHLGGDEVEFQCWTSNPEIREYMAKTGLNVKKLEEIYVRKIIRMANNMSSNVIVWQEVFDDGVELDREAIVQIWKGSYKQKMKEVTSKGFKALLSSCWYLDALNSGGNWHEFYRCDPQDSLVDERSRSLVMGGEACMWGEVVDATNVLSRVWPRASATAERLWSRPTNLDLSDASKRLEEHVCRMNRRKVPAQPPNGPGFCPGLNYE